MTQQIGLYIYTTITKYFESTDLAAEHIQEACHIYTYDVLPV